MVLGRGSNSLRPCVSVANLSDVEPGHCFARPWAQFIAAPTETSLEHYSKMHTSS